MDITRYIDSNTSCNMSITDPKGSLRSPSICVITCPITAREYPITYHSITTTYHFVISFYPSSISVVIVSVQVC